jgi:hypothetical protein
MPDSRRSYSPGHWIPKQVRYGYDYELHEMLLAELYARIWLAERAGFFV